jgi:hypothetical protein
MLARPLARSRIRGTGAICPSGDAKAVSYGCRHDREFIPSEQTPPNYPQRPGLATILLGNALFGQHPINGKLIMSSSPSGFLRRLEPGPAANSRNVVLTLFCLPAGRRCRSFIDLDAKITVSGLLAFRRGGNIRNGEYRTTFSPQASLRGL